MIASSPVMGGSTSHQRLCIRSLMRDAELATTRFTFQHRIPFKNARLPEPPVGDDVDAYLRGLTMKQASALIQALRDQVGADDEDEDEDDGD